jgi:hypothetical protein
MPETLSNDQRHQRTWCAFTHIRVAFTFLAFCGLESFLSWKDLDKPISGANLFELPFYILVVLVCIPIYLVFFRCLSERFIIGIGAAHISLRIVTWFAPTVFSPVAGVIARVFFALWVLAFLLSLNMTIQSVRNPHFESSTNDSANTKQRFHILLVVIVSALLFGALMYFIPLR